MGSPINYSSVAAAMRFWLRRSGEQAAPEVERTTLDHCWLEAFHVRENSETPVRYLKRSYVAGRNSVSLSAEGCLPCNVCVHMLAVPSHRSSR